MAAFYVLAETDLNTVLSTIDDLQPTVLIVDSIQTMYDAETASTPVAASARWRVHDAHHALSQRQRLYGVRCRPYLRREGSIAGPKVLEHMVDCVLYFVQILAKQDGLQTSICRPARPLRQV